MDQLILIYGQERYLIDKEIKQIRAALCDSSGNDVELVFIDADESTPEQILEQLDFSPLFSLERVAVIRRPKWLEKGGRQKGKNERLINALTDFLSEPPPGQIVIFTSDQDTSSHPLFKKLGKRLRKIACVRPSIGGMEAWLKDQAARLQQSITPQAIKLLARSGQDMYYLQQLMQKLSLQCHGKTVSEEEVTGEFEQREEINIFKLTDALLNRQVENALRFYYQLLNQGGHPAFFLYMIVRQFALLGKIKDYSGQGLSRQEIANKTGAKDFAVRKMAACAGKFSWAELEYCFNLFLKTDIGLKSRSRDGEILMETLIVSVCGVI